MNRVLSLLALHKLATYYTDIGHYLDEQEHDEEIGDDATRNLDAWCLLSGEDDLSLASDRYVRGQEIPDITSLHTSFGQDDYEFRGRVDNDNKIISMYYDIPTDPDRLKYCYYLLHEKFPGYQIINFQNANNV